MEQDRIIDPWMNGCPSVNRLGCLVETLGRLGVGRIVVRLILLSTSCKDHASGVHILYPGYAASHLATICC
jgi:hypothetical protein